MKNILMTIAATAMMTTVAQAEVTKHDISLAIESGNSAVCNTLDGKHGALNPTKLSDFAKCWLDVHKSDKAGGSDFGQVWAKINDKYYSVPLKTLVNAGSKTAALSMFQELIGAQVSEDTLTVINNDAALAITNNQSEIASIIETIVITDTTALKEAQAQIEALNDEIDVLEALATATSIQAVIDIQDSFNAGFAEGVASVDTQAIIDSARIGYGELNPLGNHLPSWNAGYAQGLSVANSTIVTLDELAAGLTPGLHPDDFDTTAGYIARVRSIVGTEAIRATLTMPSNIGTLLGYVSDFRAGNFANANNVNMTPNTSYGETATADGSEAGSQYAFTTTVLDSFNGVQIGAIETALQDAYDNGYTEGYAHGYADGFQDGVESVQ